MANSLEPELISEYLLPILKSLLGDKNDSVKVHSVQSAVTVAKLINDSALISSEILP